VQGSETNTLTQSGNTPDQTFSRTASGSGSYTLTDSGPGATLTNGPGSYSYGLQESGDWKSGSLSQTETGQDRYSLLQGFTNVSNAAKGTPGNLDYSPSGMPFSDDPPKEGTKPKIYLSDLSLDAKTDAAFWRWWRSASREEEAQFLQMYRGLPADREAAIRIFKDEVQRKAARQEAKEAYEKANRSAQVAALLLLQQTRASQPQYTYTCPSQK
jgi:hypothetical protein